MNKYLKVTLSSVALNLALIWPQYCWPFIFAYLIPIFQLQLNSIRTAIVAGLLWGLSFYGAHFYWLINLNYEWTRPTYQFIPYLFMTILLTIAVLIWFITAYLIKKKTNLQALSWITATLLHLWFVHNFIFIIFDCDTGYMFSNPLLPLTTHPKLLATLPCLGSSFLWLCLVIFTASIAQLLLNSTQYKKLTPIILLSLLPFIFGFIYQPTQTTLHPTINKFSNLPVLEEQPQDTAYDMGYKIQNCLGNHCTKYKNKNVFVLTEVGFDFPLNQMPEIIKWWQKKVPTNSHLIVGARRNIENKQFNSAYHIQGGKIIDIYDKVAPIFFTESMPSFFSYFNISSQVLGQTNNQIASGNIMKTFKIDSFEFVPTICSDLFVTNRFWHYKPNLPILLMMSNDWFSDNYIKNLIVNFLQLKAIEFKRTIILINENIMKVIR